MYSVISGPPPWTIDRVEPDVLEQDDVGGEGLAQRLLAHRRAAVLDHHGAAVELADVGQRLEQRLDAGSGRPRLRCLLGHRCSSRSRSCRVLRVDPHVLVAEVGEPDVGAVLAAAEPQRRSRPRRSSAPSSASSIASAPISSRSSPASAIPAAWAIRPQFGSRPKSAVLTSGELAIARATRSASAGEAAPLDLDPADPRGALAVGDDLERELQQHRLEQALGQRLAGGPGRLQQHGVVGAHLAVDGDPLEGGVDGGAQRGVGVLDDGVGLDEAEHRRHVRLDHPAALGLGGEGHAAGAAACSAWASGRWSRIASEKAHAAGSARAPRGLADPAEHRLDRQRHADHAGLGDGDRLRLAGRARSAARSHIATASA